MTYEDCPITIGELRSDRSESATDWSPRELLISLLRGIDAGTLDPESMVVAFSCGEKVSYRVSSPSAIISLGLFDRAHFMFQRDI